jgi:hypothetical protein
MTTNVAAAAPPTSLFQQRIEVLDKVVLETPALLNMVKHCQDCTEITGFQSSQQEIEMGGARGTIMGVL